LNEGIKMNATEAIAKEASGRHLIALIFGGPVRYKYGHRNVRRVYEDHWD